METVGYVILSSFLQTLSMPGYLWGGLIWFSLVPLFFALHKKSVFLSTVISFLYFFLFTFLNFYWLINTLVKHIPDVFERYSPSLGFFVFLLFCILEALPYLIFGIVYGLWGGRIKGGWIANGLFVSALLVVAEYVRAAGELGFTGGRLSDALFLNKGILQLLPFVGTYGLIFIITFVNYLIYYFIKEKRMYPVFVVLLVLGIVSLIDGSVSQFFKGPKGDIPIIIAQTNVTQESKYKMTPEDTYKYIAKKFSNTPDYPTFFPEAVFVTTSFLNSKEDFLLRKTLNDRPFAIGTIYEKDGEFFNSILVYKDGQIAGTYNKINLFPFVETLPYPKIFGRFQFLKGFSYFTPGNEHFVIDLGEYGKPTFLICFESYFPSLNRNASKESDYVVIATNDGWYNSKIALWQHFSQSIFRAVENRKYYVQVSNTGLSGVCDPYGNFEVLKDNVTTANIVYVSKSNKKTIYNKYGDYIVLVSLVILITSMLFFKKKETLFS